MLRELTIPTTHHRDFIDVTSTVQSAVDAKCVSDGSCLVYLCEFDGPRQRTLQVQVLGDPGAAS